MLLSLAIVVLLAALAELVIEGYLRGEDYQHCKERGLIR